MTLRAHFDGKVLVPEEPVHLPVNCTLELQVTPLKDIQHREKPLVDLAKSLESFPPNPDWPSDGAAQVDHYLYGQPKRP